MTFYYPSSQRTVPLLLGALVVGPLFEEMFYRYTLIYTGRKRWLRIVTTLCSLLLFSWAHIVNANGNIFVIPLLYYWILADNRLFAQQKSMGVCVCSYRL